MITINNKQVELRFGMLAVEVFLSKTNKPDFELSYYSSFGVSSIIYAGMVNFYEVKGKSQPVTFEDIYNHVESALLSESEMEEIKQAIQEFEQSQALKKKTEGITNAVEEVKKNRILTNKEG